MTIGELIKELEQYPSDYNVALYDDEMSGFDFINRVTDDWGLNNTVVLEGAN